MKVIGFIGSIINCILVAEYYISNVIDGESQHITFLRIVWTIATLIYFAGVGSVRRKTSLLQKHDLFFYGAAFTSLMLSALITTSITVDQGYTYLYIVNLLLTSVFLTFTLTEFLFISGPCTLLVFISAATPGSVMSIPGNWINILAVTFFSIVITHFNFHARLSQYRYIQIIERQNSVFQQLAEMDGLTNIANRRTIDVSLEKAWITAMANSGSISFMMIDIDFFKDYNDAYGHPAGDNCLREIVRILKSSLHRESDFVGRYGGEEFVVIAAGIGSTNALHLAHNLCQQVYDENIPHRSSPFHRVTVSIGLVTKTFPTAGSITQLIADADAAMYAAKRQGRNCVVISQTELYEETLS